MYIENGFLSSLGSIFNLNLFLGTIMKRDAIATNI